MPDYEQKKEFNDTKKIKKQMKKKIGNYFTNEKSLDFIPSGCQLLDLILGGGWAVGRVSNVVGDESTGKSLVASEACANMINTFPKGRIFYHEVESAFDKQYGEMLGMPVDKMTFVREKINDYDTVEGYFNYLEKEVIGKFKGEPSLYILDSQDFLTDNAEKKRNIEDGTYAQEKNKLLNSLYRQHVRNLEKCKVHLMIISQTREKIGVTFGRKWKVTGEGALKFAASQRIQLAELGKIKKTFRGVESSYGIKIKANCFKNKVGVAYRTCEFPLYFGFGMDTNEASLNWLKGVGGLDDLGIGEGYSYKDIHENLDSEQLANLARKDLRIENSRTMLLSEIKDLLCEFWDLKPKSRKKSSGGIAETAKRLREVGDEELEKKIAKKTVEIWNEIETEFLPKRSKY
jgi:RecA/RadA recombinase